MSNTTQAWQQIAALKDNEDAQVARHNLLETLSTAPTNRARKIIFSITSIVIAEGCGVKPLTPEQRAAKRFRGMPLRRLLDLQQRAYRRAVAFDRAADNSKLSEASKQHLRVQRDAQFEIHDAAVDEIASRVAQAESVVCAKQPGQSPRPITPRS